MAVDSDIKIGASNGGMAAEAVTTDEDEEYSMGFGEYIENMV